MEVNKILQGDSLSVLKTLQDKSISCVVTSPPYWALRDYGVERQLGLESTYQEYINNLCNVFDECKRVLRDDGSLYVNIGDCYAGNMGKKSGWTDNKLGFEKEEAIDNGVCLTNKTKIKHELPQKSLVQIPHRFAIEMANRGWILRNTIIWHKPNCMPSSANDRFTIDFEYIFFFTKNKKYYFEQQYEPLKSSTFNRCNYPYTNNKSDKSTMAGLSKYGYRPEEHPGRNKRTVWEVENKVPYAIQPRDKEFVEYRNLPDLDMFSKFINDKRKESGLTIDYIEELFNSQAPHHWFNGESFPSVEDYYKLKELLNLSNTYDEQLTTVLLKSAEKTTVLPDMRNMRCVWTITTKSFKEAHFAVYPPELIETPIKASCPEFICSKCGKPRTRIYEKTGYPDPENNDDNKGRLKASGGVATDTGRRKELSGQKHADFKLEHPDMFKGYSDCGCNVGFESGIVFDPFMGAGTTALVALKLNRRFLGIELNPKYIEIAEARIKPFLVQSKLPNLSVQEVGTNE
jgi:site-specific DNA-methyltransferase (adenine-specific)